MARPQQNSDQQRPQQPAPQSNVTRSMRMRAAIVAAVFVLGGFGTLIYNLGVLQFGKYEEYSTRAAAQQLRDEPIEANRGTIYDANMNVLAKSATVWNVVVSPKDMNTAGTDIYMVAKKLAEILELEVEPVVEKLSKSESNYQTIKRQVEKPVADEITQWITEYNADENNKKNPIRGITLEQASKRYYPYGDMGGHRHWLYQCGMVMAPLGWSTITTKRSRARTAVWCLCRMPAARICRTKNTARCMKRRTATALC